MQQRSKQAFDPRHGDGKANSTAVTQPTVPEQSQDLDDWPIWDDRDLSRHTKRSVSRIQKDQAENNENAFPCVRIGRQRRYIPNVIREHLRSRIIPPARKPQERAEAALT
jgi:hypothetical protein